MSNRAVFLDRDGTINVEKHYLHKIEDFEFLPEAVDALRILQDAGYLLIIVTNQSGIGRGYYTIEDFLTLNEWMLKELEKNEVHISKVYYCPHIPNALVKEYRKSCTCRKPALGMYNRAIEEFNIDLNHSYAIGDKLRDCTICEKSNCKGFLIEKNENLAVIEDVKAGKHINIRYANNLMDSVKKIITENGYI